MKIINVMNDSIRFINKHHGDSSVEYIIESIDSWFKTVDQEQLTSFQCNAWTELNDVLYDYYKSL